MASALRRRLGLVIACLVLCPHRVWAEGGQDVPRLAVVSDPALSQEADALTAGLSERGNVILVERDEIDRVLREHALTRLASDEQAIGVGRLLAADGIMRLSLTDVPHTNALLATVINVPVGVRLAAHLAPYPVQDLDQWTGEIAEKVAKMIPKLAVPPEEAIRLSVTPFRCVLDTRGARELERTVSFLVAWSLLQRKEFFVLERQHMQALMFEHDFVGAAGEGLWAGSFVLDGEIMAEEDGSDVTLRLRLTGADGQGRDVITTAGTAGNLPGLADSAAEAVAKSISASARVLPWGREQEAARLFRDVGLAHQAGLFPEALALAESSYALGSRSTGLLRLLVDLNCRIAASCLEPSHAATLSDGCDEMDLALRAVDLYRRYLDAKLVEGRAYPEAENWEMLGAGVLDTCSAILRQRLRLPETAERRNATAALRECISDTFDRIMAHGFENNLIDLCLVAIQNARYWHEDPQRVVETYRRTLSVRFAQPSHFDRMGPSIAQVRSALAPTTADATPADVASQPATPWLINWGGYTGEALDAVWDTFVQEMLESSDLGEQLDGWLLLVLDTRPGDERQKVVENMVEFILDHGEGVMADRRYYAVALGVAFAVRPPVPQGFWREFIISFFEHASFFDDMLFLYGGPGTFAEGTEDAVRLYDAIQVYKRRMHVDTSEDQVKKGGLSGILATFESDLRGRLPGPPRDRPATLSVKDWRSDDLGHLRIHRVVYRSGSLWALGVRHDWPKSRAWKVVVLEVNLDDLSSRFVEVPADYGKYLDVWDFVHDFDVSRDYIFYAKDDQLLRYDRRARRWDISPLPMTSGPLVTIVGEYVYCGYPSHAMTLLSPESSGIVRVGIRTLEQEVLASNRRKISDGILDDTEIYYVRAFLPGPSDQIQAVVYRKAGKFMRLSLLAYSDSTGLWSLRGEAVDLVLKAPGGKTVELIQEGREHSPPAPKADKVISADGAQVWELGRTLAQGQFVPCLCCTDPETKESVAIPVAKGWGLDAGLLLTPHGVIVYDMGQAGFLVPREEIEVFMRIRGAKPPALASE